MVIQEKLVELLDRSNARCGGMHRPLTHFCLGGQSRLVVQAAATRGVANKTKNKVHIAQNA